MAYTTLTVYAFRPLVREYSAGPKTIVNMCVYSYSRCILTLTLTHYRRYSIIYLCTLRPRSTCVYSTARVIIDVKTHRTIVFSKCICYSDIVERKIQRKTQVNNIIRVSIEGFFFFNVHYMILFVAVPCLSIAFIRVLKYNIFEQEKFVFRPYIICYTTVPHILNAITLAVCSDYMLQQICYTSLGRYSIHMSDLRILPYLQSRLYLMNMVNGYAALLLQLLVDTLKI